MMMMMMMMIEEEKKEAGWPPEIPMLLQEQYHNTIDSLDTQAMII